MQPDQNIYSMQTAASAGVLQNQQRVLRNTYLLLALSLIPTGLGAMVGINLNFSFMRASPMMSTIVLMAVIYGMFFAIEKNRDNGLGVGLLLGLTFFLGVILGPLLQVALQLNNGGQLIAMAAGGTAIVFFVMGGIATTSKRDFSFMTNFLMVGGIVLMLAVVASIFIQSPALQLTICAGFVLFSSMMILWQLNQIVHGGETNYVMATLTLYMNIYNLFVNLLSLLMAFSGERD